MAGLLVVTAVLGACDGDESSGQVATEPTETSEVEVTEPKTTTTERQITTTTTTTPTTTTAPPTTLPPTTTTAAPPPPLPPPPPPAPAPAPRSDCHPSYDPCVPYASDVDCAGGSGNGPAYTGPVRVIGPDEYDLDRDGDGWGCESS